MHVEIANRSPWTDQAGQCGKAESSMWMNPGNVTRLAMAWHDAIFRSSRFASAGRFTMGEAYENLWHKAWVHAHEDHT
jgi:hypothetical protein